MQQLIRLFYVAAALVVVTAITTDAATISLRRGVTDATFYPGGYSGVSDNTIYYYAAASTHAAYPNIWMRSSDGGTSTIRSYNGSTNIRDLLRFNLSGMSGQGVDVVGNATLTLTASNATASTVQYWVYQIAAANADWTESTNIVASHTPTTAPSKANNGDPTWWYKHIDTSYPATAQIADDTTSVAWASGQVARGNDGSGPEGYINTGGLWNWIDLVDQDPSTPVASYLDMAMGKLEPVAKSGAYPGSGGNPNTITLTIPEAMVQSWIDNPSANAGLLGRATGAAFLDFRSSEFGTASARPTLSFNYEIVPEPSSLCLFAVAAALCCMRRRR